MKERLQHHLSDVGESFDYLRSDVRNLSRYMAELEALIERYRTFATHATLSTPTDRAEIRRLLKKTQKVNGPPPALSGTDDQETERVASLDDTRVETLVQR
jgi:maltooligosyltrehalose synthase